MKSNYTQEQEDRRFREALEKRSINEGRADVVGGLNRLAAGDVTKGRPGLSSYVLAMLANQTHGQHIRQLNKLHDRGGFDRLHPDSPLARRVPASPTSDIPVNQRDDARDDRIGPELKAERVRDTGWDEQDVISLEGMRAMTMAALHRRYW